MSPSRKRSEQRKSDPVHGPVLSGEVPSGVPPDEAGLIFACARAELQVRRWEITQAFGTSPEVLRTFESGLLPVNQSLWKGYVLGVREHHDISPERADEVLRELILEIVRHEDHKRSRLAPPDERISS